MPTTLSLFYTAVVEVSVPNAVARKLMDGQDGVNGDLFYNGHGNIFYKNDEGEEVEIEGEAHEVDYNRTSDGTWGDEEESEDESEEESKKQCHNCEEVMPIEKFHDGKMCCDKPKFDGEEDEEEDCLANNPECVSCGIHLNEDDMGVWEEDKSKPPKCESCLDEEEDDD